MLYFSVLKLLVLTITCYEIILSYIKTIHTYFNFKHMCKIKFIKHIAFRYIYIYKCNVKGGLGISV